MSHTPFIYPNNYILFFTRLVKGKDDRESQKRDQNDNGRQKQTGTKKLQIELLHHRSSRYLIYIIYLSNRVKGIIVFEIKYNAKHFYSPSYGNKKSNVSLPRNANERKPKWWVVLSKGRIPALPASPYHLVHIKAKTQGNFGKTRLDN